MKASIVGERMLVFSSLLLVFIIASCTIHPEAIVLSGSEFRDIKVETIPQYNCTGSETTETIVSDSRSIKHEIQVAEEFEVSTEGDVKVFGTGVGLGAAVANKLGYTYGVERIITKSLTVKAAPGTNMEHKITWQEIWELGEASTLMNGQEVSIPFSFRTGFNIILGDSKDLGCPTETHIPPAPDTPSPSPTATSMDIATSADTPTVSAMSTKTPPISENPLVDATAMPTMQQPETTPILVTSTPEGFRTYWPLKDCENGTFERLGNIDCEDRKDNAIGFDGSGYIMLTSELESLATFGGDFSITMWFKPTATLDKIPQVLILSSAEYGTADYKHIGYSVLFYRGNDSAFDNIHANANFNNHRCEVTIPKTLEDIWYHVVFTFNFEKRHCQLMIQDTTKTAYDPEEKHGGVSGYETKNTPSHRPILGYYPEYNPEKDRYLHGRVKHLHIYGQALCLEKPVGPCDEIKHAYESEHTP